MFGFPTYRCNNIVSWGVSNDLLRVFVAQRRLNRLIFSLQPLETCRGVFREKKILTVPSIFILKCIMHVHKNKNDFVTLNNNHFHNTRHGNTLSIPSHKTTSFKHSPLHKCITIYNKLPNHIKNIQNENKFRRVTKDFFIDNVYYSVNYYLCS